MTLKPIGNGDKLSCPSKEPSNYERNEAEGFYER